MVADPAMRAVSHGVPALCAASLALPAAAGWLIGGTWQAALAAMLWAGLARIALLQHVTWSVNSLCHLIGTRPYATRRYDRATNFWPLALLSLGESWHKRPPLRPCLCAARCRRPRGRRLRGRHRVFERLGWATAVHWPSPARLAARHRPTGSGPSPASDTPSPPGPSLPVPLRSPLPTRIQ